MFVCALCLYAATPGCAVWCGCVCLGLGFGCALQLLAGVLGFCVCLCARSARTPPLLAGVCGLGAFAWARVSAAPCNSWLGCWGVRACVLAPLVPRHCWLGCACLGSGSGCGPPPLAGVLGCACLCARSACTPTLLAGVCGVGVCARARVSAAPRHSWLVCIGLCVFVCALRLYPATPGWAVRCECVCLGSGCGCAPPGWGVGVCVCLCARPACTPPLLAAFCGVRVWCCLAPVSVPWFVACCARCPGLQHPVAVVAWHLSLCLSCGRRLASLACLVAPRGAPPLARSGRSWCSGGLSRRRGAFPHPAPGFTGWLRGARGGRPRTGLFVPAAGPRRGRGAGLAPRHTRSGPRDGVVPGGSLWRRSWAAGAAVVCVCGPGH